LHFFFGPGGSLRGIGPSSALQPVTMSVSFHNQIPDGDGSKEWFDVLLDDVAVPDADGR
jgi:hypothetical protein